MTLVDSFIKKSQSAIAPTGWGIRKVFVNDKCRYSSINGARVSTRKNENGRVFARNFNLKMRAKCHDYWFGLE